MSNDPPGKGFYLVLAFEWFKQKPEKPKWQVRHWDGKKWAQSVYATNFELVEWMHLPKTP